MELVIGTRKWSSWSMRPWLVLKHAAAAFSETRVRLHRIGADAEIKVHSPSAMVPVLKDRDLVITDSLAICEYLHEQFPAARLWPEDVAARALGRSAAAEMHSGFASLRSECPMDLTRSQDLDLSAAAAGDVRRIVDLWSGLLARFGGPFLLGDWSIADAFYTPVATRFLTYRVRLPDHGDTGAAAAYADRVLQTPEFKAWEALALAEAPGEDEPSGNDARPLMAR